jgi:hypothetical protein
MNMRRILVGTIVLGIVGNALDYVLGNYVFGAAWAAIPSINATPPLMWPIIGDFCAAFMFMLMWDRFSASVGSGASAGFKLGLFAGAFVNFPMTLMWSIYVKDFPYGLAWEMVIVGTIWYGILGAVAAMLDGKSAAA